MRLHLPTLRTTPRIVGNNFCFLAYYSLSAHVIALTEAYYIYESPFFRDFQIEKIPTTSCEVRILPAFGVNVGRQDAHLIRLDNLFVGNLFSAFRIYHH